MVSKASNPAAVVFHNMYGLLTKCEVKMAGYWPSSFCVFMDQDGVEVHKLAKKEGLVNKGFYYLAFGEIFLA